MPRWMAGEPVGCRFCVDGATHNDRKKKPLNVPTWCPSAWGTAGHPDTHYLDQVNHYNTS